MKQTLPYPVILLALAGCVAAASPTWAKSAAHGKKTAHPAKAAPKQTPAAPSDTAGNWKPDPKLLAQLQPEQSFGSYRMRIPIGYTVKEEDKTTEKGQFSLYEIAGPKRPDGTAPQMVLVTALAGPGYVALSVDVLLHNDLLLKPDASLVESDMEDGQTEALEMSRLYFKVRDDTPHRPWVHGFRYAATDSHTNISVLFGDDEPYSAKTLPIAEAAVLTLNKPE